MKENARHLAAFEAWYDANRDMRKVAETCAIAERTGHVWAKELHWHDRADARDLEIAKRAEREAITRRVKVLRDQRLAGELMRRRGVEHLTENKIKETRDALTAITKGVELERSAENLPTVLLEVLGYSEDELQAEWERLNRAAAEGADRQAPGPDEDDTESPDAEPDLV
jgi:hypothetical protein